MPIIRGTVRATIIIGPQTQSKFAPTAFFRRQILRARSSTRVTLCASATPAAQATSILSFKNQIAFHLRLRSISAYVASRVFFSATDMPAQALSPSSRRMAQAPPESPPQRCLPGMARRPCSKRQSGSNFLKKGTAKERHNVVIGVILMVSNAPMQHPSANRRDNQVPRTSVFLQNPTMPSASALSFVFARKKTPCTCASERCSQLSATLSRAGHTPWRAHVMRNQAQRQLIAEAPGAGQSGRAGMCWSNSCSSTVRGSRHVELNHNTCLPEHLKCAAPVCRGHYARLKRSVGSGRTKLLRSCSSRKGHVGHLDRKLDFWFVASQCKRMQICLINQI